jgi:hypothetical protein
MGMSLVESGMKSGTGKTRFEEIRGSDPLLTVTAMKYTDSLGLDRRPVGFVHLPPCFHVATISEFQPSRYRRICVVRHTPRMGNENDVLANYVT